MPPRRVGARGRPTESTRALGNPGHRKLPNQITVIALAPADMDFPPEPEMTDGQQLVKEILDAGAIAWIGRTDQMVTLRLLAEAWDFRAKLREDIAEHGVSYLNKGIGGTRYYTRPEAMQLREVEAQITTWLSELGLTPMSRSKLGVAEVKAKSKLEEMRERRQRKTASG